MEFNWDEAKRVENLKKHGLDFRDDYRVFEQDVITDVDPRFDYGETRYYTIGLLNGKAVVLSHTETSVSIRIISFRKAQKHEQERYFEAFRDRLG